MARPWSPAEVEMHLANGLEVLDEVVASYADVSSGASDARVRHDVAFAKAMLQAKVDNPKAPEWWVKATATVETADSRLEADLAAATSDAQRKVIESTKARVEALRTLLVQSRGVQDPRR